MFAVFKTGGKQYKVVKNDVVVVEKLAVQVGDVLQFDKIMMVGKDNVVVGTPTVVGAAVHAEVLDQAKSKKVVSFVKRRRKHSSQRKRGHRQPMTVLRVKEILSAGAKVPEKQLHLGVSIVGSSVSSKSKGPLKAETTKKTIVGTKDTKKSLSTTEDEKKQTSKSVSISKSIKKLPKEKKPAAESTKEKQPTAPTKKTKEAEPKVEVSKKRPPAKAEAKNNRAVNKGEKTKNLSTTTKAAKKSADNKS